MIHHFLHVRAALLLLLPLAAMARPPAGVQARLDNFAKRNPGGIAVAWVDADGPVFFTAGKFSTDDARPVTPDTQFELGSITKAFTALLLAETERAGKVGRNDPVAKYLLPPDDPDAAKLEKITLLTLVTHRAGLAKLPGDFRATNPPPDRLNPYAKVKRADLVGSLRRFGPDAKVGGAVSYSNFGPALLGESMAVAWGTSYDEALRTRVLAPLGLEHTTLSLPGTKPAGEMAPGHAAGTRVPNWEFDSYAPIGALRSSARDMAKFLQAALGDRTAPLRGAFAETTKPLFPAPVEGGSIGLGWFVRGDAGDSLVWHNGQTGGHHSFVGFSRSSDKGVVILTNHNDSIDDLGFLLLMPTPKEIALPPEVLAEYPGEYVITPKFGLTVRVQGMLLTVQATNQEAGPVFASARDEFFYKGVNAQISFIRDAAGKVAGLVLHQGGRDSPAKRVAK
jgi:D-alanyl-D-alanine-carboxypeptidase/D-alanyl-D-alanine-endopeptidase